MTKVCISLPSIKSLLLRKFYLIVFILLSHYLCICFSETKNIYFLLKEPVYIPSCHKLNEHDEVDEYEFDEYDREIIIFKHIADDLKRLETQGKLNMDETRTVNLEKDDCVKKVRIVPIKKELKKEKSTDYLEYTLNTFF